MQHVLHGQHTHTHPFNGPFSGTTQVSRYQKGKTNLDFTEARDSEWQWHQLGYMQVCTSLQTDNHASIPPQGHAGSKTLHQQIPPVLNWGCRLMQVDLHNGHKMVAVVGCTILYKMLYNMCFSHTSMANEFCHGGAKQFRL